MSAAAEMKAVLHDWANASPNGTVPRLDCSKFRNERPPALTVGAHSTGVSGVTPWASSPVVVTILNVEPGAYSPASARLNSPSGRDATARTLLFESTTTTAVGAVVVPSAASTADWTAGSSVVRTGWGASPSNRWTSATTVPSSVTTCTVLDGVPASCSSKRASSPLNPTRSPTWYGGPSSSSRSAVISPKRADHVGGELGGGPAPQERVAEPGAGQRVDDRRHLVVAGLVDGGDGDEVVGLDAGGVERLRR